MSWRRSCLLGCFTWWSQRRLGWGCWDGEHFFEQHKEHQLIKSAGLGHLHVQKLEKLTVMRTIATLYQGGW